ncbi:MAG: SapC family protein [Aliidongia sp.]
MIEYGERHGRDGTADDQAATIAFQAPGAVRTGPAYRLEIRSKQPELPFRRRRQRRSSDHAGIRHGRRLLPDHLLRRSAADADAVLGYRPGENLFVDAEGRWATGVYVPWYVRCYPFAILDGPQPDSFIACLTLKARASDRWSAI